MIQASRRLIQKKKLWPHSQRTSELNSLLCAEGETPDRHILNLPQVEKVANVACDYVQTLFGTTTARKPNHVAYGVATCDRVAAYADVVADRKGRKERHILKCSADTHCRYAMLRLLQNATVLEQDVPSARPVDSAQTIEQRRLSRAIRSDQPDDVSARNVERDVL